MIRIIKNGEDRRRVFRFTCRSCGCTYDATEDEGDMREVYVDSALAREEMALECPMAFCRTINTTSNAYITPINEGGDWHE